MFNPANVRVLIIDDNDISRSMLRHILNANKYRIVGEAGNAQVGMEMAAKTEPHVICLDVLMPGTNGLEVLKQVKERLPNSEVMMVTGSNDRPTVMEAVQHGASGYVIKPFNPGTLLKALEQAAIKALARAPANHPFSSLSDG